jgi:DNA-binding transcriptional LysR family regulator
MIGSIRDYAGGGPGSQLFAWTVRAARAMAAPLSDLRRATGADGFRAALRYEGTDVGTLIALAAAGHGLTLLPGPAAQRFPGPAKVPVTSPRLIHRTELLHGSIGADSPAAALAAILAR